MFQNVHYQPNRIHSDNTAKVYSSHPVSAAAHFLTSE